MALDLTVTYPAQVINSNPNYPYGEARNRSSPGDSDGTPWEEQIVNDVLGMEQALLDAAGITPSGVADEVGASDYLDAMRVLFRGTRRVQPLLPVIGGIQTGTLVPTNWSFYFNGPLAWIQVTSGAILVVPVANTPEKCTLVALRLLGKGGAGSGGNWTNLPSAPQFFLQYVDGAGVIQQPTGVLTGMPVTLGAFNGVHEYVWTLDTPLPIDAAAEQLALYARFDGFSDGPFEGNSFGVLRLQAVFTD